MSNENQPDDMFENLKEGFSSFGKKVSEFVDDVMSGDTFQRGLSVPVHIYQHDGFYVIELELPGVPKEDVDVKIYEGTLIIRGNKKPAEGSENYSFDRKERRFGEFRHDIDLPAEVEIENIKAKFENGILRIRFPRQVNEDSQEIDIN